MKPVISVIVPFYKTPIIKLRKCIESFLGQLDADFELLMIDDGNTEEYRDLENDYLTADTRIRFIHQKNAGVSAARNNGLDSAQGDYIVFCDSDDFVDNNFLYSMYQAIQGYDLVICGVAEQWFPSVNSSVDIKVFCSTPTQYNWLQYVNFSVNKMYKREILEKNHIRFDTDIKLGEDALFLQKYFKHCKRIRCLENRFYHYVYNDESAVHKFKPEYWKWEQRVIASQYQFFTQYPLSKYEKMFLQRWLYIKLRGVVFYYLENETQKDQFSALFMDIIKHPCYKEMLLDAEKNELFTHGNKAILKLWKVFGVKGMRMSFELIKRRNMAP